MPPDILIAEDDRAIAELVEMTLRVSGHATVICQDGTETFEKLKRERYDLLILDVMLPGMDGFELMEALRAAGVAAPPVLFLTARIDVKDRVRGLRLGAEDYMLKPFHPVELQARAEGILRRHRKEDAGLRALGVELNPDSREVLKDGQPVELTPQEFELLRMLLTHRNMALSREQLLQAAWGYDYMGGTRTVDMHVQRLRAKLGWEEAIKTVYKLGYRLEAPR
ncbi:MAG: response regulator transcription factor [Clostridiales bacterium]|nr:response regulator transcription factor [Clostridiales bacterium]